MFETLSLLRILGVILGVLGMGILIYRRSQERVLTRLEPMLFLGFFTMALFGAVPSIATYLTALTGFTGALSRIVSVLTFATLALFGVVLLLQGQLTEVKGAFHRYLEEAAVKGALARGPRPEGYDLAVVMPAFNEADNLPEVLDRAPKTLAGKRVLTVVVDDGSSDGTAELARAHGAFVVENPINSGGGHALKVGFRAVQRLGIPFSVTMDADGQHRFEDLEAVVLPLFKGEADVVIGSRHLGESVGHEAVRAIGLKVFNAWLTFLVGRSITDCSSGYRGFNMAAFSKLRLTQRRHHTAEMIIEASRRELRLIEVPITILPRLHGESKKGTNWLYGMRFAGTILTTWWRG